MMRHAVGNQHNKLVRDIYRGKEVVLRYRGRVVTASDVQCIRKLIATHPELSRRRLSAKLCEAWDWRQVNGALKERATSVAVCQATGRRRSL